ncbi:MAG: hypothetical protein V1791_00075, partial [Pseudomonadota bacterium]
GCENRVTWQEEVKLSTGETIIIDREVRHAGGGAAWPQGQGSIPREHIIRFRYPAQTGPLIEWRSTELSRSTYAELPLVLDVSTDMTLHVFTVLPLSSMCDQYLKYQFKNGAWMKTPLTEDIETRPTNLFLAAGGVGIEGLISLAEKTKENFSVGYRSRLKQIGPKRFECNSDYIGPYPPIGAIKD